MRPATEINELALLVKGQILFVGDIFDDLNFITLVFLFEQSHSLIPRHQGAFNGEILSRYLGHALLDFLEILGGKRALIGEVVKEAIFNHWANGHLSRRKQLLHGLGHQMCTGMAQHFNALIIFTGDDSERRIFADGV